MIALSVLAAAATGGLLHPLGDWRNWVTVKDYPVDAVLARQEGVSRFELAIDQNGLPKDCTITRSSGSKTLDDQACAVMLIRARFRPPVDKAGHPMSATYRQSVHWHLPATRREEAVERGFDARATIAADGAILSCRMTGAGAARLGQARGSCGPFGTRDFLAFFLHENYGRTRATDVRLSVTFDGDPPPQLDKTPDVYMVLAKAQLDIGADGRMKGCTTVTTLNALSHTLDLCEFLKTDPPRYRPQIKPRKATILLDLSALYG